MAKVALVIGVSEYGSDLKPLPGAIKDMKAMWQILRYPELGGFTEVKSLRNPDPLVMREAIENLFSERKKDDLVVLYFSGHGIKDDRDKLYFATPKTRKKNAKEEIVKATAVPASFIHDVMNDSRSRQQVVILDCCFSGAFAKGLSTKDDGSVSIKAQLGGEGRVIMTSSASTQYSFEQKGSDLSIYTRYLVEGIMTGAADLNEDGFISVDELHDYTKKKVQEVAPGRMKPEIYSYKEGYKIHLTKTPTDIIFKPSRPTLSDFLKRYRRLIGSVVAVFLVSLTAGIGYVGYEQIQEQKAAEAETRQKLEQELEQIINLQQEVKWEECVSRAEAIPNTYSEFYTEAQKLLNGCQLVIIYLFVKK
ncbi:MAG: hypothetical protein F6K41_30245 [Symploca sp. SIO3E6]|nr:hypothetical protein [Caldora sp. SIO3E6]